MNRQELERLIGFGIHLYSKADGIGARINVERDALELSRLAKRLHHLDELYCNEPVDTNDEGTGFHDRKVGRAVARATTIAHAYGYAIYHQRDPRGACLYLVAPGTKEHDYWHDLAVPF